MQQTQNQEKQNAGNQDASCCVVEVSAGSKVALANSDALDSQFNDLCCLTAVGSRGVSGADDITGVELETLKLASANRLGMPAAGCCGGPNADSLASGRDGQRVASADVFDLSQGNNCCEQGVDNFDALVKNEQLRANHQQPNNCCDQDSKGNVRNLNSFAEEEDLHQKQQNHEAGSCCQNDAASGSENHQVRHPLSFAGLSLTAVEERK